MSETTYTATQADAQLLVAIMNGPIAIAGFEGMNHLLTYDSPPTPEQLEADHPVGSETAAQIRAVLGLNELLGTLVKQGLLDGPLVHDMLWVRGAWERLEPTVRHVRDKYGVAALYENFEALAATAP